MAKKLHEIIYKLDAENTELKRKLEETRQRLDTVGKKGLSAFKFKIAAGIGAAVLALRQFIQTGLEWIALANEQAKAEAKVEQAIRSTGNAAGLTAEQLKKTASQLQEITAIGDEEILNKVTAQLLTFTNITGENFLRTQQLALDLATVLDGDLKSAAIQLGKALNDPVSNLSALSRSGIQFSKEQKENIKLLVQQNKLYQAQTIILDEIQRQYGGQAKAVADATGALKKAENAIGDLKETLGALLYKGFAPVASGFKTLAENANEFLKQSPVDELKAEQAELNGLVTALQLAGNNQKIRNDLLKQIQRQYPDFLKNLDTETLTNKDLSDRLKEVNTEYRKKIELTAAETVYREDFNKMIEMQTELEKTLIKLGKEYFELTGKNLDITNGFASVEKELNEIAENKHYQFSDLAVDLNTYYDLQKKIKETESDMLSKKERLNKLIEKYGDLLSASGKGGKGTEQYEQQKQAIEELSAALQKLQFNFKNYGDLAKTISTESGSALDEDINNIIGNLEARGRELESLGENIGQAFVSGFDTEGLKGALKQVLITIVSFLEKEVLAAQVGAGVKAILGDPSALFQIAAITALFESAKVAINSFAAGVQNYSGGLAYVHKDEIIQLPAGSNVYTKSETRRMVSAPAEETNRLLRELIELQKSQKIITKLKGYDIYLALERDKRNRMGRN